MRRSVSEPRNGLIEAENVDADQKSFGLLPVSTGLDRVVGHYGIQNFSRAGPPLIVNSVLAALLFLFRKTATYAS
jgi:hypothetical protein